MAATSTGSTESKAGGVDGKKALKSSGGGLFGGLTSVVEGGTKGITQGFEEVGKGVTSGVRGIGTGVVSGVEGSVGMIGKGVSGLLGSRDDSIQVEDTETATKPTQVPPATPDLTRADDITTSSSSPSASGPILSESHISNVESKQTSGAIESTEENLKHRGVFGALSKGVASVTSDVGRGIGTLGQDTVSNFTTLGKGVGSGITTVGHGVGTGVTTLGEGVGTGVNVIGQGVGTGIEIVGQGAGTGIRYIGKGASVVGAATGDALKSGAQVLTEATSAGLKIGTKVSKAGLDAGTNVVGSVGNLGGTALGGVVHLAAESSGAIFEPVTVGLKTLEGLGGLASQLGEGVGGVINGVPVFAIKTVTELTSEALKLTGKVFSIPTFFDPDGDGIVRKADTTKGLILIGLDPKYASYAAILLHLIFGYSTQESWVPDFSLPIRVKNLEKTRWGKNWGTFERVEWVDDLDVQGLVIGGGKEKEDMTLKDYWTQGRQGLGLLFLIFEWGTTWPFMMPSLPINEIPFKDDIGKVVRTAILPTIVENFQKSRQVDINRQTTSSVQTK